MHARARPTGVRGRLILLVIADLNEGRRAFMRVGNVLAESRARHGLQHDVQHRPDGRNVEEPLVRAERHGSVGAVRQLLVAGWWLRDVGLAPAAVRGVELMAACCKVGAGKK